jgi:nitrogen fixation NifU-like protein
MDSMYQQQIIERSLHPHYSGHLDNPTHKAEGANLSCGDEVSFEATIHEGIITEIRHQAKACAICTASADLLAEYLEHKPQDAIQELTPQFIQDMIGIPLSPVRLKCALLPGETLKTLTKIN